MPTYLFPKVDGYVGDGQRNQKADERPVGIEDLVVNHARTWVVIHKASALRLTM